MKRQGLLLRVYMRLDAYFFTNLEVQGSTDLIVLVNVLQKLSRRKDRNEHTYHNAHPSQMPQCVFNNVAHSHLNVGKE